MKHIHMKQIHFCIWTYHCVFYTQMIKKKKKVFTYFCLWPIDGGNTEMNIASLFTSSNLLFLIAVLVAKNKRV